MAARADVSLMPLEHRRWLIAAAGAGHRCRAFGLERFEKFLAAFQTADRSGADARRALARG